MNNKKAIIVTSVIGAMLVLIAIDSYYLRFPLFIILVGVFVVLGLCASSVTLFRWLGKPSNDATETPAAPVAPRPEERYDVNDIITEMSGHAKADE